jgi:hypothetical protein
MGEYGPATTLVDRLVARAGMLTIEEAADVYQAHAARILLRGVGAERLALASARRAAARSGRQEAYEAARRAAATAWRHGLPETQGPWLIVGAAIANAAGALVVEDVIDDKVFHLLVGPWQQAMGSLIPVGPGVGREERALSVR